MYGTELKRKRYATTGNDTLPSEIIISKFNPNPYQQLNLAN